MFLDIVMSVNMTHVLALWAPDQLATGNLILTQREIFDDKGLILLDYFTLMETMPSQPAAK